MNKVFIALDENKVMSMETVDALDVVYDCIGELFSEAEDKFYETKHCCDSAYAEGLGEVLNVIRGLRW
jgi:hypothetical protein